MRRQSRFLFPVLPTEANPLDFASIMISGMTEPVVDGDGGINLATRNKPRLTCGIAAYTGPMLEGDRIDVYWGADLITTRYLTAEEEGSGRLFFLTVPTDSFVPGWVEKVYYVLIRKGATAPDPDDKSAPLRILVKLTLPGGLDGWPHLPGHSKLGIVQLPQDVINNGVTAKWAQDGVPMKVLPYENIAEHDVVQCKWGSVYLEPLILSAEQAAGAVPIEIIAKQADILAAGDSNNLIVHYLLHDQVWNYAEDWSQAAMVKVEAGAWRLDPPIIKESFNGTIDLEGLNKQPVHVQILINAVDFALNDEIEMTWIGTPQTGKPLIYIETRTINNVPMILEIPVPYEQVRAIAMGTADVAYVLKKTGGAPPLSSKRTFANVVGAVSLLPEPVILEVRGDILEASEQVATVEIQYTAMANGDLVDMIWLGTQSNGVPYVHEDQYLITQGDVERGLIRMYVPAEHIRVLNNGTLDLSYRVSNDKYTVYGVSESERLLVNVGTVRATLPAPELLEADPPDVLDPSKIFEIATVRVPDTNRVKGDILTYYWRAPSILNSTTGFLTITTVIAGQPVNFRVSAEYVTANIGKFVEVSYVVQHTGTRRYSYSATLKLLVGFLVGELPPPEVIQAPSAELDPMNALNGVDVQIEYGSMDAALDVVGLRWIGTPGGGTSDELELPGNSSGRVQFHLPARIVAHNINRDVIVSYFVRRYGLTTPSQTLDLKVLNFRDPQNQLPRPQITQAASGVLDLMSFSGNANVTVGIWPLMATGQSVWLRVRGETLTGAPYDIVLLNGRPVAQIGTGLNEVLARSELLKLRHSSLITVICKVAFDGSSDEFAAIEFPLAVLTLKTRYDDVTPVITRVTDSVGNVPDNGSTRDLSVTVFGTGTPTDTVQLLDRGSIDLGAAQVGTNGAWDRRIGPLSGLGLHTITARATATGQVSNTHSFTIISTFAFNTSPVTLSGKTYLVPGNPELLPAFGAGTSVRHAASGGTPRYYYTSSNTGVAVVDDSGLVTVRGRGAATITCRDSAGQSGSYTVNVTGVIHVHGVGRNTWPQTVSRVGQIGARLPSMGELRDLHNIYGVRWAGFGNDYYWSSDMHSNFIVTRYYMKNIVTGTEAHVQTYANYLGVGLR